MDSQETDNNATECPSDRELNAMKSNPPLPSVFRARPQGPPGSPRHPVNNGPIGQPRPGGQQIRFDNRSPVGPSNSGQFVQHWPYGPPKPSGGSFPHIPVQQGQHPPIVLSPNIPKSPVQCPGPQLGPRLPYPGNYQPQRLQGNAQRPQQQRPEYQTIPQQGQNVEVPAQPQEITQKQLQRNESSLDIPQESLPPKKEDKPAFPRIVVDKMADTDNSKKLQQFENTVTKEKTEIRENVENDDDDDVVMDGKSPRTNGNVTNQEKRDIVQPAKRPETATINGKMDNKPDVTMTKKVDGDDKVSDATANLRSEKPIKDSNMPESDSRLSSAKPAEEVHEASLDKPEIEKIVQELKEPAKRLMENQNVIGKESTTQPVIQTETKSSSIPAATEDKTKNSDSVNESTVPEDSVKGSEDAKPEQNEQKLNVQPTTPEKPRVTTPSKSNEDNSQQLQTPSKSPDKSRGSTPVEVSQDQNQQELKASKSPDKSRATTPAEVTRSQNESEPRPSSKSPQQSRESTPDVPENRNEQELKTLSKSHPITPTEVSQNQTETKKTEDKDDLKSMPTSKTKPDVDSSKEKAEGKDNSLKEKTEDKNDLSKEKAEDKNDEKLDVPLKESDKSRVSSPAEINQKENEAEVSKSSKVVEKSNEKVSSDVDHSQSEKALEDLPSKTPKESTDVAKESDIQAGLEKLQSDKLVQDTSESMKVDTSSSASEKESAKKEESSIALEDEKEVPETKLSRPELSEERVKGFDNGQLRSLSVKSSPSLSPHSPISPKSPKSPKSPQSPKLPKSPIDDEELKENEKKAALPKDSTEQEKSDEKRTPDLKNLSKTITPQKQRALTPEKLDKKPEKKSTITAEIENGSVTNESVQPNLEPTTNGVADSPTKKSPSKSKETDKRSAAGLPVKSPSKSVKSLPRTPETPSSTGGQEKKKLPMNKIQVGAAPSPNLKVVRSKIGSLENASYKPGGGKVKIEMRKLDFSKAQPKIAAKNEKYTPSGGDKKIAQVKLQWNAKPKVGSLENATYKPGGGDKKVGTVKLDFKDKAKPKVGSKDNAKHIPGGGSVKSSATPPKTPQDTSNDIQTQKIDIKAESKIGSLDNVKHKPGGGDKKIFNDKDYLRQTGSNVESLSGSGSQSPVPPGTVAAGNNGLPTSDENLNQEC